ncbi:hypothetical protein [Rhodopila globiformis]|jgi:hypothetical protein|uniref:hypothetical protein n=1 Tax=Rhodopila globiformis TaxID=1071 RepID=UPI0011B03C51|nr:hypothetical protein [Rhodopila globiformis]
MGRRDGERIVVDRPIWFRRRGALPAPGRLLKISERGAIAQVDRAGSPNGICWPLYLRHGDEVWLTDVIDDPLACWVVAVERDLVRLRLMYDAGLLPELRAFMSRPVELDDASKEVPHPDPAEGPPQA